MLRKVAKIRKCDDVLGVTIVDMETAERLGDRKAYLVYLKIASEILKEIEETENEEKTSNE